MEIQYRIHKFNNDYYPQARIKKFLFFGRWKKIAKHPTGFGLYELPDLDYPKTKTECEEIIKEFDKWYIATNNAVESYSNFNCG